MENITPSQQAAWDAEKTLMKRKLFDNLVNYKTAGAINEELLADAKKIREDYAVKVVYILNPYLYGAC